MGGWDSLLNLASLPDFQLSFFLFNIQHSRMWFRVCANRGIFFFSGRPLKLLFFVLQKAAKEELCKKFNGAMRWHATLLIFLDLHNTSHHQFFFLFFMNFWHDQVFYFSVFRNHISPRKTHFFGSKLQIEVFLFHPFCTVLLIRLVGTIKNFLEDIRLPAYF